MKKTIILLLIAFSTFFNYAQTKSKILNNVSTLINYPNDFIGYNAKFSRRETSKVEKYLENRFKNYNLKFSNNTYSKWSNRPQNNKIIICKLSKGKLFIIVKKEKVAIQFFNEINNLVNELKYEVSNSKTVKSTLREEQKKIENLKQAERELKKELERVEYISKGLESIEKQLKF